MTKRIKTLLVAAALSLSAAAHAQTLGGLSSLDKYVQKARVGLVDEFFSRFNGDETHPDIPSDKAGSRKKNLMVLFNLEMFASPKDSLFAEAEKFADAVIGSKARVNYADTTWCALAHCAGTLNEKAVRLNVYLTVERRRADMYKWVITRVEAGFLGTAPKAGKELMLMPDDHETNFLSLGKITDEQPQNIVRFMRRDFDYDATSAFAWLVHNRMLKIKHVEQLEFIFTQVPGYMFTVKYFERDKGNAGWLISSFRKADDNRKTKFLNTLRR